MENESKTERSSFKFESLFQERVLAFLKTVYLTSKKSVREDSEIGLGEKLFPGVRI